MMKCILLAILAVSVIYILIAFLQLRRYLKQLPDGTVINEEQARYISVRIRIASIGSTVTALVSVLIIVLNALGLLS